MLTFYLDRDSKTPIYSQLYQFIRQEIENGNLKANEKMPSKRKLSTHLRISQMTIDTAYQQLVAEGYLRSVPQSGFYVEPYIKPFYQIPYEIKKATPSQIEKETYQFDFKTNVVDCSLFPNTTWAKLAKEVLLEKSNDILNEVHPQGLLLLREEIATYLKNYRGINAISDQIIIGAGSDSLIRLIIQLLGRNNIIGIENPGYPKIYNSYQAQDVRIYPISLDEKGLVVNKLRQTNANIVHITPSHQFPSGVVMPIQRRLEILDWANEKEDRYIIEDDYDSEFRFSGQPIPALQGLDFGNKVIYINSFSKSLAPSMRINFLVLPINLLNLYLSNTTFPICSVPNFCQYILYKLMAGEYFERHISKMRIAYKNKLEAFMEIIEKSQLNNIIKIYGQEAGLHFLMKVNNKMTEEELIATAKTVGVRVYGLSEYYHKETKNIPNNTIVIGYSNLSINEIEKAIKKLESVWC